MTTINDIINEKRNSIEESINEGTSRKDAIEISVSIFLDTYYERKLNKTFVRGAKGNFTIYGLTEEFTQKLRDFYVICNNSFVKKVMVSVGTERKMTRKQLEIITDEMTNYPEFTF